LKLIITGFGRWRTLHCGDAENAIEHFDALPRVAAQSRAHGRTQQRVGLSDSIAGRAADRQGSIIRHLCTFQVTHDLLPGAEELQRECQARLVA